MTCRQALRGLALGLALCLGAPATSRADKAEHLAPKYQKFLIDCDLLLSKLERKAFFALEQDYQRDGFIQRFWQARDPYPETQRNEFKSQWEARLDEARSTWEYEQDDRRRVFLLHGHPASIAPGDCGLLLWPIEVWTYAGSERLPRGFVALFVQRGGGGPFRLWRGGVDGFDELKALPSDGDFYRLLYEKCPKDGMFEAITAVMRQDTFKMNDLVENRPKPKDDEWLDAFRSFSTEVPAGDGPQLGGRLELRYPAEDRSRTVVQGLIAIEGAEARPVGGENSFELQLTGEVLKDDELFESFRYRFTVPAPEAGSPVIAFDRLLRPGDYTLILKVQDLHSQRAWREERAIVVPAVESVPEPAVVAALDSARQQLDLPAGSGTATVRLAPAGQSEDAGVVAGPQRFEAKVEGGVTAVRFVLDGQPMMTKNRAPFAVDLLLGSLPRTRTLRAVGLDAKGQELAADELVINPPAQRFAVKIVDPRPEGGGNSTPLPDRVRAEVHVPDGSRFDRLEIYRGERLLSVLYQPPYSAPLPKDNASTPTEFLRAVAYLDDGLSTEDLVYLARPEFGESVDVRLVEVYATVLDSNRRPVRDLTGADFTVLEAGAPQELVRFEAVEDLPLHVLLAVDTSASMTKNLDQVRAAARTFFANTVRPKDRAALVTFSDKPSLGAEFTSDLERLTQALAGIAADRGTALWDTVVFAVHYMQGASGQAALVLLSDGADRSSRFRFEEALEFAQRAGVAVYTIGTNVPKVDLQARGRLCKLADETGGRCFLVDKAEDLDPIYAAIEQELRSRYLLVYQPAVEGKAGVFRPIDVNVKGGRDVKALAGYWP